MILKIVGSKLWSSLGFQYFLMALFCVILQPQSILGQTFGPNNPATTGNDATIGANAWTSPGNAVSSNNTYSTIATRGVTQYLSTTNFGFAIPLTSTINGIQVEVERSTPSVTNVALLDNWSVGLTKTISAGTDRCLIVIAATENGNNATDVTALTFGGQSMTQIGEFTVGTVGGFNNRIEVWILKDAGITAAGSTTLVPTISATSFVENIETYSSAVFQFVDQYNPIFQIQNSSSTAATTPYQLASGLNTLVGSMSIASIMCGNNTTPAAAIGGTNTYTINSGFTEGTDIYVANPSFSTSGSCLQTAHKASASAVIEQPTFTFAGTPNRQIAVAFTLRAATALDNSVKLIKAGTITGNDYAQATVSWPSTDTYATYGGATDLWGTTWTPAQINDVNFGAVFSAILQSGPLQVDHIRITVFTTAILPVELVSFTGRATDQDVLLEWETASELNNDFFTIEYSADGFDFKPISTIKGAGNSQVPLRYSTIDKDVYSKISYYRLKQTDYDGNFSYSDIISVDTHDLIKDLTIFPNPANASISILNSKEENVAIRLVSQAGVVMLELIPSQQFNEVDISSIPNGLYAVEILQGQNRSFQKLLVSH